MQRFWSLTPQSSWTAALASELAQPYVRELADFLAAELQDGKAVYPPVPQIFAALERTPLDKVKAVILGQDPYHGRGQGHGLSFSVVPGVKKPPSLRNILKELATDIGCQEPDHDCLEAWAERGVLLLNSVLTVRNGEPASHAGRGWEQFTDAIIRAVNDRPGYVAFVLWGSYAQAKAAFVDKARHLVIASAHPSPFAARRGFFGSRPFSAVNAFLRSKGIEEIDWRLA